MRLISTKQLLIAVIAGAGVAAPNPEESGKVLIDRATARMDAAIARVRKTGQMADVAGEFATAEVEFRRAAETLRESNPGEALLPMARSADCLRILQQWDAARKRYDEALALADRTHNAEVEAKIWLGIGRIERFGRAD